MALTIGTLVGYLKLDSSEFDKDIDKSSKKMSKFGGAIGAVGTAAVAGTAAAGVAVAGMTAKGISDFANFEASMNEVFTLLPGITDDAMNAMSDDVRKLAVEMGITTEEAVPALYQALSAGVPPENVFEFMTTAGKAAIGGIASLETSVDGISTVVNSYGKEVIDAQKAADIMFTTVKLGKTDFNQLSASLANVLPTASSVGVGFEEVGAAMSVMTAKGIGTSEATTKLRAALVEISKAGSGTDKIFRELNDGVGFTDFIKGGGTMAEAFNLLEDHATKTGKSVTDLFGSIEAGQAVLSVTGANAAAYQDSWSQMLGADGAADAAFDRMDQGLARNWQRIKVTFSDGLLQLGEALSPFVGRIADLAAKYLPIVVEALSGFLGALDQVSTGGSIDGASNAVSGLRNALAEAWEVSQPLLVWASDMAVQHGPALASAFVSMANASVEVFTGLLKFYNWASPVLLPFFKFIGTVAIVGVIASMKSLASMVGGLGQMMSGFVDLVGGLFSGDWARAWRGFAAISAGAIRFVAGAIRFDLESAMRGLPGAMARAGREAVDGLILGIKSRLGAAARAISDVAGAVTGAFRRTMKIQSPSRVMMAQGEFTGDGVVEGMLSRIPSVRTAAQALGSAIDIPLPRTPAIDVPGLSVAPAAVPAANPSAIGTTPAEVRLHREDLDYLAVRMTDLQAQHASALAREERALSILTPGVS